MNNLKHYQDTVSKVKEESYNLLTPTGKSQFDETSSDFEELLDKSKYIKVPLVGVFSSGKSSLLNVFTGKPGLLPTDTLPETAMAYELYFDRNERAEHYRKGEKIDERNITDINAFSPQPGDIAKVYINSEPIKQLQEKGIILVDMPGIGSGFERHDAAIMNYINSGTAFILLVDVEQGSLRGSTLAFMEQLNKFNLKPAILLSKTDKKPAKDIDEIMETVSYQASKLIDGTFYVNRVCAVDKDIAGLTRYLNTLDAEEMLKIRVGGALKRIINNVISDIKMQNDLKNQSIEVSEKQLKAIQLEIDNAEMELPTSNNDADTPEKSCQDILNNVELALRQKSKDIAMMILQKQDENEIKNYIIGIIRNELIASYKEEAEQYSTALGASVNEALEHMDGIQIDNVDFEIQYGDLIEIVAYIAKIMGPYGRIFVILSPLIEPLIKFFFGKSDAQKIVEIKEKLTSECFNKIVENLRPNVMKLVKENQTRIQLQLKQEVLTAFNKLKDSLNAKLNDAHKEKDDIIKEKEVLENVLVVLDNLSKSI